MNALLDYGSSSSSSDDNEDTDEDNETNEKNTLDDKKWKLPKPLENNVTTSVFSNPFVREEMAKAAILEKHVKMVPGKSNTQVINGKKICYSHRKGKCRFGHKCKYAHDTDVQKTAEELEAEKQKYKTVVCEAAGPMSLLPPKVPKQFDMTQPLTNDSAWEDSVTKKRKRPGLSQGLVPGKKVLKMYQEQKFKESSSNK